MNSTSSTRLNLILEDSVSTMLIKLAGPNLISVVLMTSVTFADAWYVGKVGIGPLASLALIFPLQSLMQMMGMGAIGGGIASSVGRAVGRNDFKAANQVIWHAVLLSAAMSFLYIITLGVFAEKILIILGSPPESIPDATQYAKILFGMAPVLWLYFAMSSILRGIGSIQLVAIVMIFTSLTQILLSGIYTLGFAFIPAYGTLGPAIATVICQGTAGITMLGYLFTRRVNISLQVQTWDFKPVLDILRVGGPSSLNSITIVSTAVIVTSLVSRYGTESLAGYGLGSRLEFMLIPLAFGVGGVLTSAVGINFGAGKYSRARKITWYGAILTSLVSGLIGLIVAVEPELWLGWFTADKEALAIGAKYLIIVGPVYGLFCGGQTLYFASQGTGNMLRPVGAGCLRLLIVSIVGFVCIRLTFDISVLFFGVAAGMSTIGVMLTWHMFTKPWHPVKGL